MTTPLGDVSITEEGRSGSVHYREGIRTLHFYWEFGGGDAVAIISVGKAEEWATSYPWAAPRRDEILKRVIDEVIRQRCPSCNGSVDENGWITLTQSGASPSKHGTQSNAPPPASLGSPRIDPRANPAAHHFATSARRARLVGILGIVILGLAVVAWLGRSALRVRTVGAPAGSAIRAGNEIVVLMKRLEPYVPSLARRGGDDRYSIGLLLHNVESGKRRYVELSRRQESGQTTLIRLVAVQGSRVWVQAPEMMLYDIASGKVIGADAIERDPSLAPPNRQRSIEEYASSERAVLRRLASGGQIDDNHWLGSIPPNDVAKTMKEGSRASVISEFERSSAARSLFAGALRLDGSTPRFTTVHAIGSGTDTLFNGAFVRDGSSQRLLQLDGAWWLMVHETKPRRAGKLIASRVDATGNVKWRLDTEIGELAEVLPDATWPAFIGERPRIPDKLSEPILVIIDARTGRATTHSLWMND